jgi:F1F0 ATPase subunit 2
LTEVLVGLACGLIIGGVYFYTLWATARRIADARRPGRLVLASYVGRLAFVALGFYAMVRLLGAAGLVAALVGFLVARHAATRRVTAMPDPRGGGP